VSSTASGDNAFNYYYFFYDWNVRTPAISCPSERIQVTATVVGLSEVTDAGFQIYPNPAHDILYVEQAVQSEWVRIFDASGRAVDTHPIRTNQGWRLNLGGLAPGLYTVQTSGGSAQVVVE
jgi:hypothetical protein